ncbi:MAG: hypothetical protein ACF8PN_05300 [Phycisphaerales bacterium]
MNRRVASNRTTIVGRRASTSKIVLKPDWSEVEAQRRPAEVRFRPSSGAAHPQASEPGRVDPFSAGSS